MFLIPRQFFHGISVYLYSTFKPCLGGRGGNVMISGKSKVFFNYCEWILGLKASFISSGPRQLLCVTAVSLVGLSSFLAAFEFFVVILISFCVYCRLQQSRVVWTKFFQHRSFVTYERNDLIVTSRDLMVDSDKGPWGCETVGQISWPFPPQAEWLWVCSPCRHRGPHP